MGSYISLENPIKNCPNIAIVNPNLIDIIDENNLNSKIGKIQIKVSI